MIKIVKSVAILVAICVGGFGVADAVAFKMTEKVNMLPWSISVTLAVFGITCWIMLAWTPTFKDDKQKKKNDNPGFPPPS